MKSRAATYRWICVALLIGLIAGMLPNPTRAGGGPSEPATFIEGKYAAQWISLLYDRVEAEAISAPEAARVYGYVGVAMYEAVMPGIPDNNSLGGLLNGLPQLPDIEPKVQYDWVSSMAGALGVVIPGLFPGKAETSSAVDEFKAQQLAERKGTIPADAIERSVTWGESIGKALLEWIANDNYAEVRQKPYTIPIGGEAQWVLTTEGTTPVQPYWGEIRTFGLPSSDTCAIRPTMDFDSSPTSTFYAQALEVKTVGESLTKDQKAIADFWVDTPGQTGAPSGHWMSIGVQLVALKDLKLSRAAEMFTLMGIALADAFIACWEVKYQVNLLRPVTYIQRYIKRTWQPYIQTPAFPEYPSGHSVASAAAAEILSAMFGTVAFRDDTHKKHGLPSRSFTSFEAAANEAAISRLYGGIHFRAAIENGMRQGRCIGQFILENIRLRPRPQGGE